MRRPPRRLAARLLAPARLNWLRAIRSAEGANHLAGGLAVGVAIACLPIFVLHFPVAIAVAGVLRVSRLACMVGVLVANPFTVLPLYSLTWIAGSLLIPSDGGGPSLRALVAHPTLIAQLGWADIGRWFLGSGAVGLALGALVFSGSRRWMGHVLVERARRRHAHPLEVDHPAPIGLRHG
jgi:uncharacterized protein (DUF2062 family)